MNKRQLEVQQVHLDNEKKIIRQLKKVYTKASEDCEAKIIELASRTDMQNLQSIIYQKQYQEALKKQLDGILDNLQSEEFNFVTEYLSKSYEDGFIGTLYDLHGQGIPLIFPIDERQVVKALQTDSKLSQGLYSRLGEDVGYLKKSVRAELSRGIANGSTWLEMAGHIATGMNSPYKKALNNAIRIARTEGHRIQNLAQMDSMREAINKGADVAKQWDSTLDKRTRPTHQRLDGQIRELDEPFEVDGKKTMHPGGFGKPSEDCNCRCCMLQRARWALDEDELQTLQERAEYYGLDKTESFADYKKKYLDAFEDTFFSAEQTQKITIKDVKNNFSVDRKLMNSKKYHDKFEKLTDHRVVNESIYQESMKILEHRDGTEYEDIVALGARTGSVIARNTISNQKGKTGFSKEQYDEIMQYSEDVILLHNHPNSSRLSYTDISTVFNNEKIVGSIAASHDGTLYIINNPNREFDIDQLFDTLYNRYKQVLSNADLAQHKALDDLYEMGVFDYESR